MRTLWQLPRAMAGTDQQPDGKHQISRAPASRLGSPMQAALQNNWITRRRTNVLLIAGAMLSMVGVAKLVSADRVLTVAQAMQFVQQSGEKLLVILNGKDDWPEQRRQLEALINQRMDVYGIARFALGRYWNLASAAQRDEYVRLFPTVLLGDVGRTFGAYQGMKFTVDRGTTLEDWVQVWTTVLRPGDPSRQVGWVIGIVGDAMKVVDIVAEGESLRITQRDDCASFLARNNRSIDALLGALRRQVEVTS